MKTLVFFLSMATALVCYGTIDTLQPKSNISHVTVFFSGAQVTRKADLKLKKGSHILMIDQLPQEIVPNSVQVSVPAQYKILAVKHVVHQANPNVKTKQENDLTNQIDLFENKIKELQNEISVLNLEEGILLDKSVTDKTARDFTAVQLKEVADFYRTRLNEIRRKKLSLSNDKKNQEEEMGNVYEKINELTVNKRKVVSQIFVSIEGLKELAGELKLSYYVSSAGWDPTYDFRVEEINKPFEITYNANVFQSSGEDWNNVKLTLSTSNPSLSGDRQKLSAWYIERPKQTIQKTTLTASGAIKGTLLDKGTKEPMPFVNVSVFKFGELVATVSTNMDGEFFAKPIDQGMYDLKAVYVGYQTREIKGISVEPGKTAYVSLEMNGNKVQLNEVEVLSYQVPLIDPDTRSGQTITRESYLNLATKDVNSVAATTAGVYEYNVRGGRSDNETYYVDGTRDIETLYLSSTYRAPSASNKEYVIEAPYSIPSDGADYNIRIKEQSLKVNYLYYAVPKLEQEVFLSAQIADWTSLNLINGKYSVYFQDTYVGQSVLDVSHIGDTLSVSLGRDKDVQINREANKLASTKRSSGSYIKEMNGTNIVLRNNKNQSIKVMVEDQYPLSDRKSIEIELVDAQDASVTKRSGKLNWELTLEPGEKKLLSYTYSLRYPKWAKIISE